MIELNERNLIDLYNLRRRYIKEGYHSDLINEIDSVIKEKESILLEDGGMTSATGGLSVGAGACSVGISSPGMGPVSSSQPSAFAGSTIGADYTMGGGHAGSGDIGVPLNMGPNGVYTKIPGKMIGRTKDHGGKSAPRNRRNKKMDLKALKNIFAKRPKYGEGSSSSSSDGSKSSRVMNFDNFAKSQFTKVTKNKE